MKVDIAAHKMKQIVDFNSSSIETFIKMGTF